MERFRIDFRRVNLLELKSLGIFTPNIEELFVTQNAEILVFRDFSYAIGYVKQSMFIHAVYEVSKNDNFDIELLQAAIPNEEDIRRYWCKGKNRG